MLTLLQLRSKAILLRDLEALRAKRIAKENPAPTIQKIPEAIVPPKPAELQPPAAPVVDMVRKISQPGKSPIIKQEVIPKPPEKPMTAIKPPQHQQVKQEPKKEPIIKPEEAPRKPQVLSPPPSSNENTQTPKPVGLGINTDAKPAPDEPTTSEPQNSGVDSLFDIPDNGDGNGDLDFDDMDFSFGADTGTAEQSQTQTQNNEFDLSTFGNTSQDLSMNNSSAATAGRSGNNANAAENKQSDELLAIGDLGDLGDLGNNDSMDLDLNLDMFGAEDSVFDDMFVDGGDMSGGGSGGGENTYDNAFFGLD